MTIAQGNKSSAVISNFIAKYGSILQKDQDMNGCSAIIEEFDSTDIIKHLHLDLVQDFSTDIASPYFIMPEDITAQHPASYTIYRITDWCTAFDQDENDALLLHEIGHIKYNRQSHTQPADEERFSDLFAASIIDKGKLKSALDKIISNKLYATSQPLDNLKDRISNL